MLLSQISKLKCFKEDIAREKEGEKRRELKHQEEAGIKKIKKIENINLTYTRNTKYFIEISEIVLYPSRVKCLGSGLQGFEFLLLPDSLISHVNSF